MGNVGKATSIALNIVGVLGLLAAFSGYASMSKAETVFQEQESLTMLSMGGIVFAICLVGNLVYLLGNAMLARESPMQTKPEVTTSDRPIVFGLGGVVPGRPRQPVEREDIRK